MKKMMTLCGVCAALATAHGALPSLSDLAERLTDVTGAVARVKAGNEAVLDAVAAQVAQFAQYTNLLAVLEKRINEDKAWYKLYHGGFRGSQLATNEYGIVYKLNLYGDGTIRAAFEKVAPLADPEAEAKVKAEIAARQEEARQKMEAATLPANVAEILRRRRAAMAGTGN